MTDSIHPDLAANLRAVADLLDAHPDLPNCYITAHGSTGAVRVDWQAWCTDKAAAALVVSTIPGTWERDELFDDEARWIQQRDGVSLIVTISRELVCERRVVGTETVTIPAVEAQPERTEVREIVEWDCGSLLAPEPADLSETPC